MVFQAIQHLLEVCVGVAGVGRERLLVRLVLAGQERAQQEVPMLPPRLRAKFDMPDTWLFFSRGTPM